MERIQVTGKFVGDKEATILGEFNGLTEAESFAKTVDTEFGILDLWYADGESAGHVER